jgi:hypothetical protein
MYSPFSDEIFSLYYTATQAFCQLLFFAFFGGRTRRASHFFKIKKIFSPRLAFGALLCYNESITP